VSIDRKVRERKVKCFSLSSSFDMPNIFLSFADHSTGRKDNFYQFG